MMRMRVQEFQMYVIQILKLSAILSCFYQTSLAPALSSKLLHTWLSAEAMEEAFPVNPLPEAGLKQKAA